MKIIEGEYNGEGMSRVYENPSWTVGIKNWKPASDISGLDCLERHNLTDELFILLSGKCSLLYANEEDGKLVIEKQELEPFKVYTVPTALWHNAVMVKGTKMALIENSSTSMANSEILPLDAEQLAFIKTLIG